MSYIETFTKKEIENRVTNYNFEIKDILDLDILFQSIHNLYEGDDVTLHENFLEIDYIECEEFYFDFGTLLIYLPKIINDNLVLPIEFVDVWDIDDEERTIVINYLAEVIPDMISVDDYYITVTNPKNGTTKEIK